MTTCSGPNRSPIGRLCRHTLSGTVAMPKSCLWHGACSHCAFDQWLEATAPEAETEQTSEPTPPEMAEAA